MLHALLLHVQTKETYSGINFLNFFLFVSEARFSVTAQRKLKCTPELCVDGFLEIFLLLLVGPLWLMLHTTNSVKNLTLSYILGQLHIFRHGATKTPIFNGHSKTVYI